jgi:hypothetical protein
MSGKLLASECFLNDIFIEAFQSLFGSFLKRSIEAFWSFLLKLFQIKNLFKIIKF